MPPSPAEEFLAWRREVERLAAEMYGRTLELELEDDLVAGYSVGDTPAELVVGVFSEAAEA
jgi:hypothetical protein